MSQAQKPPQKLLTDQRPKFGPSLVMRNWRVLLAVVRMQEANSRYYA